MTRPSLPPALVVLLALHGVAGLTACGSQRCAKGSDETTAQGGDGDQGELPIDGKLPLCVVKDIALPGNVSRFDYQDVDLEHRLLIVAHMGDSEVNIIGLDDDSVKKTITGIATARGVLAAPSANRLFASAAATDELVIIDATTLEEKSRVATGAGPDGLAYDPTSRVVAVSAQRAGEVTLLADDGDGERTNVAVGEDTGNVAFHAGKGHFFAAVVNPDQIVEITPDGEVVGRIDVPGCPGAHGLRFHPDGNSAIVACELGATITRVQLDGDHDVITAAASIGPDVLSIDPEFEWVYVAAEGGDPKVFDIGGDGLVELSTEHVGNRAHSVAVDPQTHRVYFPLEDGGDGKPVLRVMAP